MMTFRQVRKYGAGAALMGALGMANATASGFDTVLAAVDLTTISAAVVALAVLIVGIKLVFKGPDIAGRVIRKV